MYQRRNLIPLNTVEEIIAAWGGTKLMAKWCGTGMPNISKWIAQGYIANGWHYRLDREAKRRGYLINPKVFGEEPNPDERPLLQRARAS
jgi:hypothetical protein